MTEKELFNGLTEEEATKRLLLYGKNEQNLKKSGGFFSTLLHALCEPMFLLLIIAAVVYFILGEPRDGAIMLIFVVGIIGIDVFQEWKTDKTLNALKDLSAPRVKVIRDGKEKYVLSAELVPGDVMLISEGVKIPADGVIIKCADLCVDESSLTGESAGVWKNARTDLSDTPEKNFGRKDYCFTGTLVTQGTATVLVEKTGLKTEFGKIGESVASAPDRPTPLEKQTKKLVKACALIALVLFVLVCIITFLNLRGSEFANRLTASVLSGVTLAMAMIPEEFPVILTVFLSMGAWRLAKKHSLVRRLPSVETLGAVSVLCVDKTGTITQNKMTVIDAEPITADGEDFNLTLGLACESETYDPMEKAMLSFLEEKGLNPNTIFSGELVREYAFTNELKMMGHVWKREDGISICAKGSPEKILTLCSLTEKERAQADEKIKTLAERGLRVIAVAKAQVKLEDVPENLTDAKLRFIGLVGLADPPRESVKDDIAVCKKAGIRVVMITGDNGDTAAAIARQVGMEFAGGAITGDMLDNMSDEELKVAVKSVSVFARVVPEHKMRIVKAFKEIGEIVAMTGDGVNDAPALKYADIGIAMGGRGSEVAREAADLILMDDNFTTIVETVKDGRRIFDNIRRAVGYVFSIHIPIALASLLVPLLGIPAELAFILPLHVVLLEVLIDPTCSIVLERQPSERNIMERPPRNPKEKLLNAKIYLKSILLGITAFAASFGAYYVSYKVYGATAETARSLGLTVIMIANLFLVQVGSSDNDFAMVSAGRLIRDKVMWAVIFGTIALIAVVLYSPINAYLKLAPLSFAQIAVSFALGAASALWYELVKLYKKIKCKQLKR